MSTEESQYSEPGVNVPPSTKVRLAQRVHLLPKTFHSIHDAQKHCQELTDAFKKLDHSCKEAGKRIQEMAASFGPEGYQLEKRLGDLTNLLSDATAASAANTEDIMNDLQAKCKSVGSVEPEYRRACKEVDKAKKKSETAERKKLSDSKISNLSRELERKTVNRDITREEYSRRTLGLGLHMVIGFLDQLETASRSMVAATSQVLGSQGETRINTVSRSLYEDSRGEAAGLVDFTCPIDSVAESSSLYDTSANNGGPPPDTFSPSRIANPDIPLGPTEPPSRISRPIEPLRWSILDPQGALDVQGLSYRQDQCEPSDTDSVCSPWK